MYDAFTYAVKAKRMWEAAGSSGFRELFAIEPTVRPPGTVLVTYPLGFDGSFRGFYFRTVFIPAALLALAALIAAAPGINSIASSLLAASLAIALSGLPPIFQLHYSKLLPASGYWGLVDCFLAGLAAMAAACAWRSARTASSAWFILASGFAVLALWTKPAGALVMFGVAAHAALRALSVAHSKRRLPGKEGATLAGYVAVFATALWLAAGTPYFSPENFAFGRRALEVLHRDFASPLTLPYLLGRIHVGIGWPVVFVLAAGVWGCFRERQGFAEALAGIAIVGAGGWFWLGMAEASQVRYFLPFAVMGSLFLVPCLVRWCSTWGATARVALTVLLPLPALASGLLSLSDSPPPQAQSMLGISLVSGETAAEVALARELVARARREGGAHQPAYSCSLAPPSRAVQAVVDFDRVVAPGSPFVQVLTPHNWSRGFAIRLDEVVASRLIACDTADAPGADSPRALGSFPAELRAFRSWLERLDDSAGGVRKHRAGGVLVTEVVDAAHFEEAVARFAEAHTWRPIAAEGYAGKWLNMEDLRREATARLLDRPVGFRDGAGRDYGRVLAVSPQAVGNDMVVDVFVEPAGLAANPAFAGWKLFVHGMADDGSVVVPGETTASRAVREGQVRRYRVLLPNSAGKVKSVGLGFYEPATASAGSGFGPGWLFAVEGKSDWGGRRLLLNESEDSVR